MKNFAKNFIQLNVSLLVLLFSLTLIGGMPSVWAAGATGTLTGGGAVSPAAGGAAGGAPAGGGATPAPSAAPAAPDGTDPAIECKTNNCDLIGKYVNPAINLFSVAFALIAVISIILGSINYTMSEGDPQKSSRAKQRITNTIIAVVAYIFLYGFLQFLVPGGLFKP